MSTVRIEERVTEATEIEVRKAAREFAAVLASTPQYEAFDRAASQLRNDETAQRAIGEFMRKQQSLQVMQMLGALSQADRRELQRQQQRMAENPTVKHYFRCQEELTEICQEMAKIITETIGVDFAASCGPGCC